MKWEIKNGIVQDEDGAVVCVMSENATELHIALIKNASDMFDAIMDYLQSVESTSHPRNPKKHYNKFQKIFERINDEA
jgi:hypothetical protein